MTYKPFTRNLLLGAPHSVVTCLALMAAVGLAAVGCGGDSDTPAADAGPFDANATDVPGQGGGGQGGGGQDANAPGADGPDAGSIPDAPGAPAAPILADPMVGAATFGEIRVRGTGEANATLRVRILRGNDVLGQRIIVISDAQGRFDLSVFYRGATTGQSLSVEVIVENDLGRSPAATRQVTHTASLMVAGKVTQSEGSKDGTKVVVRLYRSNRLEDLPFHVAEQVIAVAAGVNADVAYQLPLASGTFWLRAFRDVSGRFDEADGEPTLGVDPQSQAVKVTVTNAALGDVELALEDTSSAPARFVGFNVNTINFSPVAFPPSKTIGTRRVVGKGACGGFYLEAQAEADGNVGALTAPWLLKPNGDVATLADDGACGPDTRDNSTSSYDEDAGDGRYRFGVPSPSETSEGRYTFFYALADGEFIHIETDDVPAVKTLSFLREFTSPATTTTLKNLRPTFTWKPVPDAKGYLVVLTSSDGRWDNEDDLGRVVGTPEYRPSEALPDDTCFRMNVIAADGKLGLEDADAAAFARDHEFCTDLDGTDTVTVTGSVANRTVANVPIGIRVTTNKVETRAAVVRLAAGATTYTVGVLGGLADDGGKVSAFLDRAGSGHPVSLPNEGWGTEPNDLDLRADATVNLTINPPVDLETPVEWFGTVARSPLMRWKDYAQSAGASKPAGPFSYVVWVGTEIGFPLAALALPPAVQSFDFANVPAARQFVDLPAVLYCQADGGLFATDAAGNPQCQGATLKTSVTRFDAEGLYVWGVFVVPCDFATFSPPAQGQGAAADPFITCALASLAGNRTYTGSATIPFLVR
jgi:hypothetical protein